MVEAKCSIKGTDIFLWRVLTKPNGDKESTSANKEIILA